VKMTAMTANSQRLSLHGSVGELAAASCARGGSCSGRLQAGSFLVVSSNKIRRPKGRRYKTVAQRLRLDQVVADGEADQSWRLERDCSNKRYQHRCGERPYKE